MEAKYYTSITELPLSKFIDCLVDNNLYALVKQGEPVKEQLEVIWDDILMAFNDAVGDNESKLYMLLYKDLGVFRGTLAKIDAAVQLMDMFLIAPQAYEKRFGDDLNKMLTTKFAFDLTNPEQYRNELQRCLNRSKTIKLQYNIKKSQFDEVESKRNSKKGEGYTREYFQTILINLSDLAKYEIQDSITVFQFCERLKRYIKVLETEKVT